MPGKLFEEIIDLLTRYWLRLISLITRQFYASEFLKPELKYRLTVRVENMKKTETLPHLCENQHVWTMMKGSSFGGNLLEKQVSTSEPAKGFQSTGRWGLQRKEKCQDPCLACGSADLSEAKSCKLHTTAKDGYSSQFCCRLESSPIKQERVFIRCEINTKIFEYVQKQR